MADESENLQLSQLIKSLRAELAEAKNEGDGKELRFTVEDVELELDIVTEKSQDSGVAAKFYVLTGHYKEVHKDAVKQKIRLKLKPQEERTDPVTNEKTHAPTRISGTLPDREE